MTSNIYPGAIDNSWHEPIAPAAPTVELLIFQIGEIYFGVSISQVDRVVDLTNTRNDFSFLAGVEPLDLHERLFGTTLLDPVAWVIVNCTDRKAYGIAVGTLPTLVLVPIDRIRLLPHDYSTSPLGIASYVAMLSAPTGQSIAFMLAEQLSIGKLT